MTNRDPRAFLITSSGRRFWPLEPRVEDVDLADIAHALANVCRYGGHARTFYSVAEHSVLVARHVPIAYAMHGLLHDATEAYLGDVVRPIKHHPAMLAYREAEAFLEAVIAEHFGIVWTPEARAAVKEIDDRILADERAALLPESSHQHWSVREPLGCAIYSSPPHVARRLFVETFTTLLASAEVR